MAMNLSATAQIMKQKEMRDERKRTGPGVTSTLNPQPSTLTHCTLNPHPEPLQPRNPNPYDQE